MGQDMDHSDFVDPDFELTRRGARPGMGASVATAAPLPATRPPSREEITRQVTASQQALVELKRRQEELERERAQLEEARRRRLEFEQGREEMLAHLTRGIGLLTEAEHVARRDAEQMGRSLADLKSALDGVSALHEESWSAETYPTELTRALTTIENARMEWNAARLKWPMLSAAPAADAAAPVAGPQDAPGGPWAARTPAELARFGLALTWPVALAVLVVGVMVALVLSRR